MSKQAHRFTTANAVRFFPTFTQILAQGDIPLTIRLTPSDLQLSTETVLARIRDAARSISLGHVVTPTIDADRFTRLWNQYYVTTDGEDVLVVPKAEKERRGRSLLPKQADRSSPTTDVVSTSVLVVNASQATEVVLRALALLLGLRILQLKVEILDQVSEELATELMNNNDVMITKQDTNKWMMI